jgi:hypothetical protein
LFSNPKHRLAVDTLEEDQSEETWK